MLSAAKDQRSEASTQLLFYLLRPSPVILSAAKDLWQTYG